MEGGAPVWCNPTMPDTLQVDPRESLGTRNSRKLRATGIVPAILYGRNQDPVSLAIRGEDLRKALDQNAKVVSLSGSASGQALVQQLQWDTFHRHLLHVDLLKIEAGQRVRVSVRVELKGDAPGLNEGGVVEQTLTQVEIEAQPASIPEVLHLDATQMHLGEALNAGDVIDLPEGAELITPPDQMVFHCVRPAAEPTLDEVAAEAVAPEVIGKADKEESDEEGGG